MVMVCREGFDVRLSLTEALLMACIRIVLQTAWTWVIWKCSWVDASQAVRALVLANSV